MTQVFRRTTKRSGQASNGQQEGHRSLTRNRPRPSARGDRAGNGYTSNNEDSYGSGTTKCPSPRKHENKATDTLPVDAS